MNLGQIFYHWERVRKGLLETIDCFDEGELVFAPFEGAWPVRKIIFHIAGTEDGWFRYSVTKETEIWPEEHQLENYPDKTALKNLLSNFHIRTVEYLRNTSIDDFNRQVTLPWGPVVPLNWIFWHILEHEIHHRGELSIILGMLGKEAPDV